MSCVLNKILHDRAGTSCHHSSTSTWSLRAQLSSQTKPAPSLSPPPHSHWTQCRRQWQKPWAYPGTRSPPSVGGSAAALAGKQRVQCRWQLPVRLLRTSWASKCGCHITGMLTSGRMEVRGSLFAGLTHGHVCLVGALATSHFAVMLVLLSAGAHGAKLTHVPD